MIITTSRKPSRRTRTFGRDLSRVLIGRYITRGSANIDAIVEAARNAGEGRVVFVYDIHGNPGKLSSLIIHEDSWEWHPLIINIRGVKLQREVLMESNGPKKVSFRDITLKNETKHDLNNFFDLLVNPESRNRMVVTSNQITFMMGTREVGPKFNVLSWYYADKDRNEIAE